MNFLRRCCVFAAFAAIIFLSGCESTQGQGTIYSWGDYEEQVYSYLSGENRDSLLLRFQRELEIIETSDKRIPPGFYAHLGLLFAESGQQTEAYACFMREKEFFPEAAPFMDFLLRGQVR